jgi:hypothetical protein
MMSKNQCFKKTHAYKKRVTIKEVAQAAGFHADGFARAERPPRRIEETRERVRAVISELGYSPNALARSLIQGRTHTLGVVGYGLSYYGPARVLTGIERRANEMGYSLLLSLLREPETNQGRGSLSEPAFAARWTASFGPCRRSAPIEIGSPNRCTG